MAILAQKKRIKLLFKIATGYVKYLLSSEYVVMNDDIDLETTITNIKNDIGSKYKWTKLCELAGNSATSKTFTVKNLRNYSEILLTCGPAVAYQTGRILSSTVIPIANWNWSTSDYNSGAFQAVYDGKMYVAGVSRMSDTSVKLYANTKTVAGLFVR